jgi:hypothetical protein
MFPTCASKTASWLRPTAEAFFSSLPSDYCCPINPQCCADPQGQSRVNKGCQRGEQIERWAEAIVPVRGFNKLGGCVVGKQVRTESAVNKQSKAERHENERAGVKRGSHVCGGRQQVGGEDRGRVGDEGDREEQAAVAEVQARIGAVDIAENSVVMHPHDEDGEEAGDQREVAGPKLQERFSERGGGGAGERDWWNFQFEDQKGDGDGEDPVAEGFEAASFFFALGCDLRLHGE